METGNICSYVTATFWRDTLVISTIAEVGQAMWDICSGLHDTMDILR